MYGNSGFVDLRVGHGSQGVGDDSVWPSFTDIMTVIVMIFLMALVVMMVRNFELDRQLVTTMTAQEASFAENQSLVDQLTALEARLLAVQQSLATSTSEKQQLAEQARVTGAELATAQAQKKTLSERVEALLARTLELTASEAGLSQQIATLSEQFNALQVRSGSEIEGLTATNLSLSEQLEALTSQLAQVQALLLTEQQRRRELDVQFEAQSAELQAIQQQAAQDYAEANLEIEDLTELIRRRQAENAELQALADASTVQFRSLREEYESLDAKYRELARPARSPAGKYVVEVWFSKTEEGYRFQLKEPSQDAPVRYPKAELDQRLADLKAERGENLYTRVIIPEDSQLSHNEAWRFTQEILRGYDYYDHQYPRAPDDSSPPTPPSPQ